MSAATAIVDPLAPHAYSGRSESLAGLGGTEATVVRVAEGLGGVSVFQCARRAPSVVNGVRYMPVVPRDGLPGAPGTILVINAWKVALILRRRHPGARILLWLHVVPGRHNRGMAGALHAAGIEVVCVSASHARQLRAFLPHPQPVIRHVANPIDPALRPDDTPRDPNLLLFASSPHKGLDEVYRAFSALRARIPGLRLAVADPGYLRWNAGPPPPGVLHLGRLAPEALHQRMRRALCLFYPQTRFVETFGLVIAEANALGCPALLHRGLGANDEVASDPGQLIDATDPRQIAGRIARWRLRPPPVAGRAEFRADAVIAAWRDLLSDTATHATPDMRRAS
jgi:glycosyltransferase involved in cell wall biosynthesis